MAQTTWTGAVDTDFATAGNWSNGVPGLFDAATIGVAGNQPIVAGAATIGSLAGGAGTSVTLGGTFTTGWANTSTTFAGTLSGSGGLDKTGSGTFTLSGQNTYTGATSVSGGILLVSGAGSVASTTISIAAGNALSTDGGALSSSASVTNNGSLQISGSETIATISGSGGVTLWFSGTRLTLNNASGTYSGVISGEGGLEVSGGTQVLSGANTYSGTTTISGGVLSANSSAALGDGSATNTLIFNGGALRADGAITSPWTRNVSMTGAGTIDTNGNAVSIAGQITGAGNLTKAGAGTLTLTATSTGTGSVAVNAGTLSISGAGAIASTAISTSAGAVLATDGGALASGSIVTNAGSFQLTGSESIASVSGAGTVALNGVGLTLTLNSGPSNISGVVSGTGNLEIGGGTTTLSATNTYSGTTDVDGGKLVVSGSIAASTLTTINNGATVGGTGTLGNTTVASGGIIAPGNSIGTLAITGTYTASTGSFYDVEVDPNGTSDRIAVTGNAVLNGGTVRVSSASGANLFPLTPSEYTILTTTTGITGNFAAFDTSALAFFNGTLDSGTVNTLKLILTRNDVGLADVATTDNQRATAGAIESLGSGNPLYAGILGLSSSQAQSAYDQLSGEGLASAQNARTQNASLMAGSILDRIRQAFEALRRGRASGYAPMTEEQDGPLGGSVWLSGYGSRSSTSAISSHSASFGTTGGLMLGLDGSVENWTVGVLAGYGRSANAVQALQTTVNSVDYTAGLYAGGDWDAVRVALGAAYTHHGLSSSRSITLPSAQTLTADYSGSSLSLFGEAEYEIDLGAVSITPFAGVQYVRSSTSAYAEQGGTAALSVAAQGTDTVFTTIGVRTATEFVVADDMLMTLGAGAGWKHAFGGQSTAVHSFAAGGGSFTVTGAPIAADRVAVEGSVALDVSESLALNASYLGELAYSGQAHQIQAGISGRF